MISFTVSEMVEIAGRYDSLLGKPASDDDIKSCNEAIGRESGSDYIASLRSGLGSKSGGTEKKLYIPDDYAGFLRLANGYAYNGYFFYGTKELLEREGGFCLPDILEVNEGAGMYEEIPDGFIVVGRHVFDDVFDDVYAYDTGSRKYYVFERGSDDYGDPFDSFESLFTSEVNIHPGSSEIWGPEDVF